MGCLVSRGVPYMLADNINRTKRIVIFSHSTIYTHQECLSYMELLKETAITLDSNFKIIILLFYPFFIDKELLQGEPPQWCQMSLMENLYS